MSQPLHSVSHIACAGYCRRNSPQFVPTVIELLVFQFTALQEQWHRVMLAASRRRVRGTFSFAGNSLWSRRTLTWTFNIGWSYRSRPIFQAGLWQDGPDQIVYGFSIQRWRCRLGVFRYKIDCFDQRLQRHQWTMCVDHCGECTVCVVLAVGNGRLSVTLNGDPPVTMFLPDDIGPEQLAFGMSWMGPGRLLEVNLQKFQETYGR